VPLAQLWTHWGLNWISFQTQSFAICLNFQNKNLLKNQFLSHLSFENCEIISNKSDLPRPLQHHEHPQIPTQFSVSNFLLTFRWENGLIINSFHTVAPNSLEQSWCTPYLSSAFRRYEECSMKWSGLGDLSMTSKTKQTTLLSKDSKSVAWNAVVWEISAWETKQNKLLCFIDIVSPKGNLWWNLSILRLEKKGGWCILSVERYNVVSYPRLEFKFNISWVKYRN
jgi:hypothetical protein